MKQKKFNKKLTLGKVTISSLADFELKSAKGGAYVTYLSDCCTVNMATCLIFDTYCFRTDTYQPGGTACP